MLLARFNLSNKQALRWYQETERAKAGITLTDTEILANPYQIYEVVSATARCCCFCSDRPWLIST